MAEEHDKGYVGITARDDQEDATIRDAGTRQASMYRGMVEGGMTEAQAGQAVAHFGYILLLDVGSIATPKPFQVHKPGDTPRGA